MSQQNRIILLGTLEDTPQSKPSPEGSPGVQFHLKVQRFSKADGSSPVDLVPIVAWQNQADYMRQNAQAGDLFLVEGRIQVRNIPEQGQWVTEVIASLIQKASAGAISSAGSSASVFDEPALDDVPF